MTRGLRGGVGVGVKGGRGVCYINLRTQGGAWKNFLIDQVIISKFLPISHQVQFENAKWGLKRLAVTQSHGGGSGGNISDVQQTEN